MEKDIKNIVINECCLIGSQKVPDNSVDMVFCDLPYGETQNSWDNIIPYDKLWEVINRVKKKNAVVCLFSKGIFLGELICSNVKNYKYKVVIKKRNPKGFLNANKMPLKAHEDVLIFYEKPPLYQPQKTKGHSPVNKYIKKANSDGSNYGTTTSGISGGGNTDRFPTDVLEFAWDTYPLHPTQKPIALCEWFIKTFTKEGMTILDLTTGYGSIPLAAIKNNRNFYAFENGKCEKAGPYLGIDWAVLANNRIQSFINSGKDNFYKKINKK